MDTRENAQPALFEHQFWLQVLGDHARFILMSLGPAEQEEIARAGQFRDAFDRLLQVAREEPSGEALSGLNRQAWQLTEQLRGYKLHLLRRHLEGQIQLSLTPAFINHMVNELEEYMRVLQALLAGQPVPRFHPVHHHLLWLLDGYGHASAIAAEMDFVENAVIMASRDFARRFNDFYLKAVEMAGFLRTNIDRFPALARFNKQTELEMLVFQKFLNELKEMELSSEVLSTFTPLMADHMYREECYYLLKLSEVSDVHRPDCDPAKPRVEA